MTTHTYYYIDIMHIPAREPFKHDSIILSVLDKKININEYIKIVDESENEIIIEENIDYPRLMKFYKTKDYAKEVLQKIIDKKQKLKPLDIPKIHNMMTDIIKENFMEKK